MGFTCEAGCTWCPLPRGRSVRLPGRDGGEAPVLAREHPGVDPWALYLERPWDPDRVLAVEGDASRVVALVATPEEIRSRPLNDVVTTLGAMVEEGRIGAVDVIVPAAWLREQVRRRPGWTGRRDWLRYVGISNGVRVVEASWDGLKVHDGFSGSPVSRFRGRGFVMMLADGDDRNAPDRILPWIDVVRWPGRMQVMLRLGSACNHSCPFCMVRPFPSPGPRRILSALEDTDTRGRSVEVSLTGGEPFLEGELPRVIHEIAELMSTISMALTIQTNASLVASRPEAVDALAAAGCRGALVNLPSFRQDTYASLTGGRGRIEEAVRGIDILLERGIPVTLNLVLSRRNAGEVATYVEQAGRRWPESVDVTVSTLSPMTPPSFLRLDGLPWRCAGRSVGEAVEAARRCGVRIALAGGDCSPPACVMPAGVVQEEWFQQTDAPVRRLEGPPEDGVRYKSDRCRRCQWDDRCPGIAGEHVRVFGIDALGPPGRPPRG